MEGENNIPAEEETLTTLPVVFAQLQDVVLTQHHFIGNMLSTIQTTVPRDSVSKADFDVLCQELENEKREHQKTKDDLASQSTKLQFALGELDILTTQLTREKALFEESFGKIKERALQESTRSNKLESQCTTIKAEKEKQEDLLNLKDTKISDLKKRLANQRQAHQLQLQETDIRLQQEAYISQNTTDTSRRGKKTARARGTRR